MASFSTPIRHVVVLMLENRSFDHICGWLGRGDGLTDQTANPENPHDPTSPLVHATRDANWIGDLSPDAGHSLPDVNEQLFGTAAEPSPPVAVNNGFVANYARRPGNTPAGAHRVMRCFDPARVPATAALAREFVLCDRWFASVPGQTWPNRFFAHAATSGGFADNQFRHYGFETIYDRLHKAGHEWAIYFHDIAHAYTIASIRNPLFIPRLRFASQFFHDLKHDHLPAYSFIEPRYFDFLRWKANDQHPPHDVRLGEHLIADVYEALRRSSAWPTSMLIVLFDEHGGLFDHVSPPAAVNPDGKTSVNPLFRFDRLGPRVPALIVSPRVARGGVDSTVYDHSSLVATARALFDLGTPLTGRDAAAHTLVPLLRDDVRSDAPEELPRPPEPTADAFHADSATAKMTADHVTADLASGLASSAPLSEFQRSLIDAVNALQSEEPPRDAVLRLARLIDNEHEGAVHVREFAARVAGR